MPVMETDMEDPEYIGKQWKSAVASIIAAIDNSSSYSAPAKSNIESRPSVNYTVPSPSVYNISSALTPGDVAAVNTLADLGHHHSNSDMRTPSSEGHEASGSKAALPSGVPPAPPLVVSHAPSPSVTVIPVLFPYLVPGRASDTVAAPSSGSSLVGPTAASNHTEGIPVGRNTTHVVSLSPSFGHPPVNLSQPSLSPVNITHYNLSNGVSWSPPSPDASAVVGWAVLAVVGLLVGLAALALLTSHRLRVWLRHRVRGSRYFCKFSYSLQLWSSYILFFLV